MYSAMAASGEIWCHLVRAARKVNDFFSSIILYRNEWVQVCKQKARKEKVETIEVGDY